MKKILIFITAIFLSIGVFGQDLNYVNLRMMKAVVNSKADTSLSNLSSVAINTHLLPATSGSANLGSALLPFGDIYANGTVSLPLITSIGDVSNLEISYLNGVTDSIQKQLNNKVDTAGALDLEEVVPLLVDTIPLVTFGAGAGLIADTALFNNGVLIGCFYNEGSDTLVVTQLMGILKEGTGTETIAVQISWHATMLSGSATSLNATALAIAGGGYITTGVADVSFANSKIPPNVFVWGILSGASSGNKPTFLSVTLSGYKIPKY